MKLHKDADTHLSYINSPSRRKPSAINCFISSKINLITTRFSNLDIIQFAPAPSALYKKEIGINDL